MADGGRLRAAPITDGQTAAIQFGFTCVGDNLLSVGYGVSSEEGWDFFIVLVDGAEVFRDSGDKSSGESFAWPVPDGPHTVEFRYSKDEIYSELDDTAYLDLVEVCPYIPPPPAHLAALDYYANTLFLLDESGTVTAQVPNATGGHRENMLRLRGDEVWILGASPKTGDNALLRYSSRTGLAFPERYPDPNYITYDATLWTFELLSDRYAIVTRSTPQRFYLLDLQDQVLSYVAGIYQGPLVGYNDELLLADGGADRSQTDIKTFVPGGGDWITYITLAGVWALPARQIAALEHFYVFEVGGGGGPPVF